MRKAQEEASDLSLNSIGPWIVLMVACDRRRLSVGSGKKSVKDFAASVKSVVVRSKNVKKKTDDDVNVSARNGCERFVDVG